ncbi:MAG: NAD-dependent epimerase/dehydratase, partial [uncultured bacterium]
MSNKGKVLITGGAGFIGSHTADELERRGFEISIFDNLSPKTHFGHWPDWVKPSWNRIQGDVRNRSDLEKSLDGVTHVIHLAALMDLMPNYSDFFDTNVTSTALIYEIIVEKKLPIQKVLVASSQFVYGEGIWKCAKDGDARPKNRTVEQMISGQFDPVCPICSGSIEYQPQKETYQDPPNQYAISKYSQELIALKLGRLNNIPSAAMRYSIVHGPRQSLKNAYSGALRIFTLKMLANQSPTIFEDGLSQRDYVSVFDVARANADVLESDKANYENFNVGSGKSFTVIELAEIIARTIGIDANLTPCGEFRVGDNRHAVSDISK